MRVLLAFLIALFAASAAWAGDTVGRAPPPPWVKTAPTAPAAAGASAGDAFRIELLDQQFRFDDAGSHAFIHTRVVILAPQALSAFGSVALPWNPVTQDVTVHALEVIRGEQRIDALAGKEFSLLRREANLESAIVDGLLTATLQLDDLRVGDRVEFSYSVSTRIPVLGSHAELLASGAVPAMVDQYFLRASWPTAAGLRLQASSDWTVPPIRRRGDESEIEVALAGLEPLLVPEDAPARFHFVRQIEASDYASWAELATVFAPLYESAAVLMPDSPLRAEVERIRAAHADPADQALAALRLVQDEVRYLALAMGEGGLIPATADETWNRRLGDCKGKTVLLIALLQELGIEARPVLVSTFDDVLDARLPRVTAFDHVIVQAEVNGQVVWLDGTRSGDRSLVALPPLDFGWVLPVEPTGSALVRMPATAPEQFLRETILEFDLSGGLYVNGPVTGEILVRGDPAVALQSQFAVATQAQRDAYMRASWPELIDGLEVTTVGSSYDIQRNELRWTMTGRAKLDWASRGGRRAEIPVSRVSWSAGERRPEGPFRDLPINTNYPGYSRFQTTIILPENGDGFVVSGDDIDAEAAGYRHRRAVAKDGARVVMERSTLVLRSEITEAERAAAVEPLLRIGRQVAEITAPRTYEASADDLNAIEDSEPSTVTDWVNRGLALSSNNLSAEAIVAFDRAIALDPRHANAYANRGIVRFWSGDMEGATADFDKASELNPSERVAMNGRGMIALQEGRHLDAVVEFTMSLRAQPDDTFVLRARSSAYMGMKEWDKSLADLRRMRELRPGAAEVDLMEVIVLAGAERLDEAAAAADALVLRDPSSVEALQTQASVRELRNEFAGAEASLSAALALESDDPQLLLKRAGLRFRLGDLDGARADLAIVRPMGRSSSTLMNNLCWTQAVAGVDLEQALADCDAALTRQPSAAGYLDSRGLVLLHLGRPAEALEVYDRALALEPAQASSLYGRSLAKQALGRGDEAAADRQAALRIAPDVGDAFEVYEARLP